MTRVGQILVIMLSCFSLLFMGFAVSVYTTRTNWRDKYFVQKKDLEDLQKKRDGLKQQVDALTQDITISITKHKQDQDAYAAALKDQQKNYEALLQNYQGAKKDALAAQEQVKTYGDLAKEKSKEVALLREQLKTTREQREDAVKKQFDTQQQFIELKGSYETLDARTRELEQRRGELEAILISRGIPTNADEATNAEAIRTNAPPVEGVVLKIDPQGKLVEISIGSDDGLRKGHRLHVYRVKPQGRFVCTIEITQVDPDQAVARIVPNLKQGNPQEGDLVATRITASR
jgi:predicted  nucleic acid-binding Zn-ribbon protein